VVCDSGPRFVGGLLGTILTPRVRVAHTRILSAPVLRLSSAGVASLFSSRCSSRPTQPSRESGLVQRACAARGRVAGRGRRRWPHRPPSRTNGLLDKGRDGSSPSRVLPAGAGGFPSRLCGRRLATGTPVPGRPRLPRGRQESPVHLLSNVPLGIFLVRSLKDGQPSPLGPIVPVVNHPRRHRRQSSTTAETAPSDGRIHPAAAKLVPEFCKFCFDCCGLRYENKRRAGIQGGV
jgi:hypothetical protein